MKSAIPTKIAYMKIFIPKFSMNATLNCAGRLLRAFSNILCAIIETTTKTGTDKNMVIE